MPETHPHNPVAPQAPGLLAAIVENSDDAIISKTLDGIITSWNAAAQRIYGYSPAEAIGRSILLIIPDDRREEETEILARLRRGERIHHFQTVRRAKDGRLLDVSLTVSPVRDEAGRIVGASKIARDVTDRAASARAAAHLAALVDSSDDAIISKSLDGIIQTFNRGAERLFGYAAEEAIGRPITILIPGERHAEEVGILARIRAGQRVEHFDTLRLRKDGTTVPVSVTVSPILAPDRSVIGASKIARDITDRLRAEAELREHRHNLQRLVEQRTAELDRSYSHLRSAERLASIGTLGAGLGHDMGNMLLPVATCIESLRRELLPEHARADVEIIETAVRYLRGLAQSLRLLALDPEDPAASGSTSTDMAAWWRELRPVFRTALPRTTDLAWEAPDLERLPAVGLAPHQLTQVIFNLVQNAGEAMQHAGTPRPRVHISAGHTPDGQGVRIEVADNGPGMSDELVRRCMEPFFTTKTRKLSTGMGLAIVRATLERAGGNVAIISRPGEGARFVLDLPPARAHTPSHAGSRRATISVRDARVRAFAEWALRDIGLPFDLNPSGPAADADLWVVESAPGLREQLRRFTSGRGRAVLVGKPLDVGEHPRSPRRPGEHADTIVYAGERPSPIEIKDALRRALAGTDGDEGSGA